MSLSDEQLKVLSLISCKRNVLITGPGGTGKSYLIKHIVKLLNNNSISDDDSNLNYNQEKIK